MEEDYRVTVSCLSSFADLDRFLNREGLKWGSSSKHYAIRRTLKRLGQYTVQKVVKKLVQQEELIWDHDKDFEVEAILDHATEQVGDTEIDIYLIKWKGWTHDHNTWEPKAHLDCPNLLEEFHKLHKAGALRSEIVARMSELTHSTRDFSHFSFNTLSEKLAEVDILPSKIMDLAKGAFKRKAETAPNPKPKRKRFADKKIDLTNKRSKAYKTLKAEMDLALKQWEKQINTVDTNQAPITIENDVDLDGPPDNFVYTNDYIAGEGLVIPQDPLVGCECDNCIDEKKNCCGANAGCEFAYYKNRRVRVKAGTPIYECNSCCKCAKDCPNRVVQFGRQHKVCLFKTSNGRGWGVKASQKIKKGSFVVEYVGEVITHEEAERRGKIYDGAGRTYLFDLDYNDDDCPYTVDAGHYGNISHFINHSCDPNLVVYGVWINTLDPRLPRIALFAQKDLEKGEELTFDYMMTAETTSGFGVRAQESQQQDTSASDEESIDVSSDTQSETTSENNMDTADFDSARESSSEDNEVFVKPPVNGTELSALEVKAEVSKVTDLPPTPPPSEIQESLPREQKSPVAPIIRHRVVCQCGASNCRGYLY